MASASMPSLQPPRSKKPRYCDRFMPTTSPLTPYFLITPPLSSKKFVPPSAEKKKTTFRNNSAAGATSAAAQQTAPQLPRLGHLLHTMADVEQQASNQRQTQPIDGNLVSLLGPLGPPPQSLTLPLDNALNLLDLSSEFGSNNNSNNANDAESDEDTFDTQIPSLTGIPGIPQASSQTSIPQASTALPPSDISKKIGHHRHGHKIAKALGFQNPSKVFSYQPPQRNLPHYNSFAQPSTNSYVVTSASLSPNSLFSPAPESATSSTSSSYFYSYTPSGTDHKPSSMASSRYLEMNGPVARLLQSSQFQHPSTGDTFSSVWGVYDDEYFDTFESVPINLRDQGMEEDEEDDYYYFYDGDDFTHGTGAGIVLPPSQSNRAGGGGARAHGLRNFVVPRYYGNAAITTTSTQNASGRVYNHIPYRILDAPGLRNDFYSNLVSWSGVTGQVAVGLLDEVYVWSEGNGATLLRTPTGHGDVTSVVFAPVGMFSSQNTVVPEGFETPQNVLAIGYKDGTLVLYSVDTEYIMGTYTLTSGPVSFLCWMLMLNEERQQSSYRNSTDDLFGHAPNTPESMGSSSMAFEQDVIERNADQGQSTRDFRYLLIGDDRGSVTRLYLEWRFQNNGPPKIEITMGEVLKGHSQQICAIAFSLDQKQVAIGGNDNLVTIWDVKDWNRPTLVHKLAHRAAIKAMEYCPWAPYLLATGAGSQDRALRFWHTRTGTLLKKIETKGQITSVIWSRHKRQLVATFGFHDNENPVLLAVYAFPQYALGAAPMDLGVSDSVTGRIPTGMASERLSTSIPGRGTDTTELSTAETRESETITATTTSVLESAPLMAGRISRSARLRDGFGDMGRIPRMRRFRGRSQMGAAPSPFLSLTPLHRRPRYAPAAAAAAVGGITGGAGVGGSGGGGASGASGLLQLLQSHAQQYQLQQLLRHPRASHRARRPPPSRPLMQVLTPSGLRVLSAAVSPDGTCLCVATNDETVRFFKLWNGEGPQVPMTMWQSVYHPNSRVLESDLIEFREGIEKVDEIIR